MNTSLSSGGRLSVRDQWALHLGPHPIRPTSDVADVEETERVLWAAEG